MTDPRRILAMGGGGFTMEPDNPALDDYALSLTAAREPRVLFLPTASGDPTAQITSFYGRFGRTASATHLSLFRRHGSARSLAEIVLEQDVIYVGGGSMRNLLAIWSAHELDTLLIEAWTRGIVLVGLSAGAMCWFEGGITRSGGPPETLLGLGLLPGSFTVHADGEPERLPVWLAALRSGELPGGWAADDGVALLFHGTRMVRAVSSRPGTAALKADMVGGELVRHRIEPELLGSGPHSPLDAPVGDDIRELRDLRYGMRHR
ncbi:Type 1 glutamine amidotransferase-like domain-containing protein [Conexibacter woesei]|uniref:Peptidase S51 dipeptidase E n=1 Tax=Conexibacter woesei (strain DSM 14684 / CCUG 47730 / CIP 108061 / JCM 11494 / NBRC 100937 / ID131577) TaxID=469383 RepID=D3F558_CONWI|nr:peptidase E [Conexibacter woesei]ADB48636.1 peptidase S51 dipeptidase E [Conexibacter woesei DSM 14684]